ncbi:hypothetical protein FQN49_005100 [Arthroderma sp. PD_2]|nr:hypothetical protein FQN49_005100 [Arthroderma sp. PD_2]
MPNTLTLLCFQQSRFFPDNTAHWGLFLREEGAERGTLFHAAKDSLTRGMTEPEAVPGINPRATKSLRASVEVASGLALDSGTLNNICNQVAENRRFDFIVNNCQRFCSQILQRLVDDGTITQAQFDALAIKGFRPLV